MNYDGYLFDLPGRAYTYEVVDLDHLDEPVEAAVRAIASAIEPTVVEVVTEAGEIHQLRGGDKRGGAYREQGERTRDLERIDASTLASWVRQIKNIATLSIRDGWFRVTAKAGDTLRIAGASATVESHDGAAVRAPNDRILLPPFGATLDAMSGRLTLAVHWSPWTDPEGVGRSHLDRLRGELRGWRLVAEPAAESLDWRRWVREAPIVPLRPRGPDSVAWSAVPARRVELGLTADRRDRLAEELLEIDRALAEAEPPVGYREYNATARKAEIVAALAVTLGHKVVEVTAFEIMQQPVSNKMWAAYMTKTGAPKPASWAAGVPDDDPVTGISQAEAAAFAIHHGWALPNEAEWQLGSSVAPPILDGMCEYTSDVFAPYPGGDANAFPASQICARGSAAKLPPCTVARRGLARDHRFKFARFRCVR